jgi:hypothetical protein
MLLTHLQDAPRIQRCLVCDFCEAAQEELQPALPVATIADGLQAVVVLGSVEARSSAIARPVCVSDLPLAKQECYEQATDSAIAI